MDTLEKLDHDDATDKLLLWASVGVHLAVYFQRQSYFVSRGVFLCPADQNVPGRCDHRDVVSPDAELPSQRGETWNDTEAIARHRALTPSQRVALAIEISRAALRFAQAERIRDDATDVRA